MANEFAKYCEQAIIQTLSTAGVSGLTIRAYRVDDETSSDAENIRYPLCQIVAEPVQETQQGVPLYSCAVSISVATYYDDDKKRETLSTKSALVWDALTSSNVDTAMGTVTGASNLGVQGLTYDDVTINQDNNDQRATRVYTLHLFDAS